MSTPPPHHPETSVAPVADRAPAPEEAGRVAQAAVVLSLGNVLSRLLGLARELVIADLFGATGLVSVLRVAITIPTMIYDLLVGGMISAALVPVFSDYASPERRTDLWRIASILLSGATVVLTLAVLLLEVLAPGLVWALGSGYDASLQEEAVGLVRLVLPATLFISLSGIVAALLYALKRFRYPAFTAAFFNLSIVVSALVLSRWIGIASVLVGVLLGALGQLVIQIPGLRDFVFRPTLNWNHPALRRILSLYAPVIAGLIVSNLQIALDRNLASHTGAQSVAWMQNATTLIQFPLGLVATAISLAILPTLAQQPLQIRAGAGGFQDTLALGLKWVILLILPAAFGLWVLAGPVVALLFEHGAFTATDTFWTATALRFYLFGLPFAAIDQPLVFAFYARKDTLTPAVIGVVGVGIYLLVALGLMGSQGMVGLVVANSAQLTGHALLMLGLFQRRFGGLGFSVLWGSGLRILFAAAVMAWATWGLAALIEPVVAASTVGGKLSLVAGPLAGAVLAYMVGLRLLRVREAEDLYRLLREKLVRG